MNGLEIKINKKPVSKKITSIKPKTNTKTDNRHLKNNINIEYQVRNIKYVGMLAVDIFYTNDYLLYIYSLRDRERNRERDK